MIVPSWFLKSVSVQQMSLLIISDAIWGKNAHFSFMLWKYQILRRNIKWEIKKSYEPRLLVIFSLVSSDKCPNLCFKNVSQEIAAKPFKDEETVLYTKKITFMKHKKEDRIFLSISCIFILLSQFIILLRIQGPMTRARRHERQCIQFLIFLNLMNFVSLLKIELRFIHKKIAISLKFSNK